MWSWVARNCQHIKHLQWFISPHFEELFLGLKREKEGRRHPTCHSLAERCPDPRCWESTWERQSHILCCLQWERTQAQLLSVLCSPPASTVINWAMEQPQPSCLQCLVYPWNCPIFQSLPIYLHSLPNNQSHFFNYWLKLITFPTSLYYLMCLLLF